MGLDIGQKTSGKKKKREDGKGLDDHKNNLVQCLKAPSNKNTRPSNKNTGQFFALSAFQNFFLRFMRRQTPSL